MARKISKKIWRPLFHGTFIGPVQIKNALTPSQNFEAKCDRCSWTSYPRTKEEARDILLWHLDQTHFDRDDWSLAVNPEHSNWNPEHSHRDHERHQIDMPARRADELLLGHPTASHSTALQ
jgi:hypothetical protein